MLPVACRCGLRFPAGLPALAHQLSALPALRQPMSRGVLAVTQHAQPPSWHQAWPHSPLTRALQLQRGAHGPLRHSTVAKAASGDRAAEEEENSRSGKLDMSLVLGIGAVVSTGILNRVLYKMALVPLHDYVFALAQLQTFGYVFVYGAVLLWRYRQGVVTQEMLDVTPKKFFLGIGLMEAMSSLLGFVGAANLPGVVLPLLSQTALIWQISLAALVLGRRFTPIQLLGAAGVGLGVCIAAYPTDSTSVLANVPMLYGGLYVASMLFPSLSSIFKEKIFATAKERMNGQQLDLFVVNTFGSAAQALFVFLLLPVLTNLRGMSLGELPSFLMQSAQCLGGMTPSGTSVDCSASPLVPLAYLACNLAFNISVLSLLRRAGNVVQSLVMSSLVPLTIFAFTLPWPLLDPAPALGAQFQAGVLVLLAGLATYQTGARKSKA